MAGRAPGRGQTPEFSEDVSWFLVESLAASGLRRERALRRWFFFWEIVMLVVHCSISQSRLHAGLNSRT